MASGIYSITAPSGKRYIGSAVNIARRWGVHRSNLISGRHHNKPLCSAFRKYGLDNLRFEILELCAASELIEIEQRYIDSAPPGTLYNICATAGSVLGRKHTDTALARMREAMTPEKRARIADAKRGRVLPAETLARMSTAQQNRSADWRRKISEGQRGKFIDAVTRERMSAARNTSGYPGVSFFKRTSKWTANLRLDGKQIHLGYFTTAEMANAYRLYYLATMETT